jgi:hypothetical protein
MEEDESVHHIGSGVLFKGGGRRVSGLIMYIYSSPLNPLVEHKEQHTCPHLHYVFIHSSSFIKKVTPERACAILYKILYRTQFFCD